MFVSVDDSVCRKHFSPIAGSLVVTVETILFAALEDSGVKTVGVENIKTMKDAGISYFTLQRMPTLEGESKELTLGEMLKQKL